MKSRNRSRFRINFDEKVVDQGRSVSSGRSGSVVK